MALSSFQNFFCRRNITGGYHPRLWSFVSSRLLASLHELLFVRNTDERGPKRKRGKFSQDSNICFVCFAERRKMTQGQGKGVARMPWTGGTEKPHSKGWIFLAVALALPTASVGLSLLWSQSFLAVASALPSGGAYCSSLICSSTALIFWARRLSSSRSFSTFLFMASTNELPFLLPALRKPMLFS